MNENGFYWTCSNEGKKSLKMASIELVVMKENPMKMASVGMIMKEKSMKMASL